MVDSIEVVTAKWSSLYPQSNTDPANVVDILPIYLDYTRANQLLVRGRWLTASVSVTVGARLQEQQRCTPCGPGYHAGEPGSANCTACEAGTHSASPGQPSYEPCMGNSWQLYSATRTAASARRASTRC